MNATIYTQALNLSIATVGREVLEAPKADFSEVQVGHTFLRVKEGKTGAFLKIGKRSALLLINSKGQEHKVLKFKETNKVIPMDTDLVLAFSPLNEEAKAEIKQAAIKTQRAESITIPKQEKQIKPMQLLAQQMLADRAAANNAQQPAFN